ncbi:unnamed protein product [Thelazia callipaeda]|uniref:WW domain-containing protein n=1 Tax=Thelazia callipaeda TaxID=103827 RepID=A0A0N5CWB9_THECL|nr:unnamed protein product [Thelazia callipaeda]
MLNRRRRHQVPTFLEGTPGRYLRREAPLSLPTCNGHDKILGVVQGNQQMAHSSQSLQHVECDVSSSRTQGGSGRTKPELSSQSFNESRTSNQYLSKRGLTSSLSIGNVVQHGTQAVGNENNGQRMVSVSLQSLPGRSINASFVDEGLAVGVTAEDLVLPPNWAVEVTPEGIRYFIYQYLLFVEDDVLQFSLISQYLKVFIHFLYYIYYVDHNNRRTHWIHPLVKENLPLGWIKQFDAVNGVTYYNELDGRTQLEHPGLATPVSCTQNNSTAHLTQRAESTIENLNIIGEDIPDWIRLYSRAPYELDHLLEWTLFRLPQLQQYDSQLMKLYKQECIDIAIKYERFRLEINREIARRQQKFMVPIAVLQQ